MSNHAEPNLIDLPGSASLPGRRSLLPAGSGFSRAKASKC